MPHLCASRLQAPSAATEPPQGRCGSLSQTSRPSPTQGLCRARSLAEGSVPSQRRASGPQCCGVCREATPQTNWRTLDFAKESYWREKKKNKQQPQKLPSKTFFHSPKKGNFDVRKGKGQNLRIKFLKPSKPSFMRNPPTPCYFYFSPLELKITLETPQHPPFPRAGAGVSSAPQERPGGPWT